MLQKSDLLNQNLYIVDITKFTVAHKDFLGGTLSKWADHWKGEIDKVGDNVGDFFEKVGEDIKHLPEDAKKAVRDIQNELLRVFGKDFVNFMKESIDKTVEILDSIPTPEEYGKQMAVHFAQNYKAKEGNLQENCAEGIKGILIMFAASLNMNSGGAPNPYAQYIITYYALLVSHGCSEAYK